MNKQQLIEKLVEKTKLSKKDATLALDGILDIIAETLAKKEKVALAGFGTFLTIQKKSRTGRNPKTGETITIPEKIVPKFKPGKGLKEKVK